MLLMLMHTSGIEIAAFQSSCSRSSFTHQYTTGMGMGTVTGNGNGANLAMKRMKSPHMETEEHEDESESLHWNRRQIVSNILAGTSATAMQMTGINMLFPQVVVAEDEVVVEEPVQVLVTGDVKKVRNFIPYYNQPHHALYCTVLYCHNRVNK